jgi:outer membrane protein TolC
MKFTLRSTILSFSFLFVCVLAVSPARAQSADSSYSFSLKQAIDYALTHQPSVLNAALDEQIAKQKVNEVRGIGLPQVNASLDLNDFISLPTSLIPGDFFGRPGQYIPVQFGTKYNSTAGITASQLVFDGSYIVGLQATKTYLDLSRKLTARSKIETVEQVTKAYYAVLINEKNIGLLDANIARLHKIYQDTKAMNEAGFVEKLDVDRLEVTLNNLEVTRSQVQSGIGIMNQLLKFHMGMPINANLKLTDTLTENFAAPVTGVADPGKRIEYSLLQTQRKLHELDLKRHRYGYFPSLAAFGSLSYAAQRNEFNFLDSDQDWYKTALIGAKLTVPVFDGLQKQARIQQSKLNIQKTENDINTLRNGINLGVSSATIQYDNAYKTLNLQKQNLDLAKEVVRVTQIKYNEGVGSNIEVINAETSLREAQTNYFKALYDLFIAQVDLQKAQGTLY